MIPPRRRRGLTIAYGPHAEPVLRDLDLLVPEGDHLTVVGPSGIGKSTLAALVCGLLRPQAGTVRWGGVLGHWEKGDVEAGDAEAGDVNGRDPGRVSVARDRDSTSRIVTAAPTSPHH